MVQYTSNVCGQNKTTGLIIIINNKLFFFFITCAAVHHSKQRTEYREYKLTRYRSCYIYSAM